MSTPKAPPRPGSTVEQIVTPIKGKVTDIRWLPDDGEFQVEVEYPDAEGTPQRRWFREVEVKEVESAADTAAIDSVTKGA